MYLLAEILVGFVTSAVGSIMQQAIDDGYQNIDWRKALESGVNGAISSALPPIKRNFGRTGKYTDILMSLLFIALTASIKPRQIVWKLSAIAYMAFIYFSNAILLFFSCHSIVLRPRSLPT